MDKNRIEYRRGSNMTRESVEQKSSSEEEEGNYLDLDDIRHLSIYQPHHQQTQRQAATKFTSDYSQSTRSKQRDSQRSLQAPLCVTAGTKRVSSISPYVRRNKPSFSHPASKKKRSPPATPASGHASRCPERLATACVSAGEGCLLVDVHWMRGGGEVVLALRAWVDGFHSTSAFRRRLASLSHFLS